MQLAILAGCAGLAAVVAVVGPGPGSRTVAWSAVSALIVLAAIIGANALRQSLGQRATRKGIRLSREDDPDIVFMTDDAVGILWCNGSAFARARDGAEEQLKASDQTIATEVSPPGVDELLAQDFASPADMMRSLSRQVVRTGSAHADVAGHDGLSRRLWAARPCDDTIIWTLSDLGGASDPSADNGLPTFVLDSDDLIVSGDAAFSRLIGRPVPSFDDLAQGALYHGTGRYRIATQDGLRDAVLYEVSERRGQRHVAILTDDATGSLPNVGQVPRDSDGRTFDALPVAILHIGSGSRICRSNRQARSLLGMADEEDGVLSDLVEGLGRPVAGWIDDALAGRGLNRPEVLRASNRSTDCYVQITLGQLALDDEPRLVAVLHDATELKTLEAQFVQSQKMQAIGQLAGGVAHDFNNLLTAISGHCDLLLLRHDQGDPDFSDLEQIAQNANRAASLVGQLLAFSRKQNLRPELLDMRDTLAELTHLLDRLVGERVTLSFDHDPALQMVRADKRQLEQVIMNLVVNARDAMPDGGPIRIETEARALLKPLKRDRVVVPVGEYVIVRVSDEGTGIAPDKLPKIFEPFFTTKRTGEGTGLGLSTAYGIVKQTGGYIFADSVVGEGTAFSLYFPSHPVPKKSSPAPTRPAAKEGQQRGEGVILLVEDEAPVRAFASRALSMRGYTVVEAENGEMALDLLSDADLAIDVFVTDVIMPGMDGPTWVRRALESRPGTRVVFVSGYAEESFADSQARIPNSVFLPKPFSLVELTATVARILT